MNPKYDAVPSEIEADRLLTQHEQPMSQLLGTRVDISESLEKIDQLPEKIRIALNMSLKRTDPQDWVRMKSKGKDDKEKTAFYLCASGCQKIKSIWGLYIVSKKREREDFPDGTYAYIYSAYAGSQLLDHFWGRSPVAVEGARWSGDPFFSDPTDPMDVMKSAESNLYVRATNAVLGLNNLNEENLKNLGVNVDAIPTFEWKTGGKGGASEEDKVLQNRCFRYLVKLIGTSEEEQVKAAIYEMTEFVGRDGTTVKGVNSIKDLKANRLRVTWGKIKERCEKEGIEIAAEDKADPTAHKKDEKTAPSAGKSEGSGAKAPNTPA